MPWAASVFLKNLLRHCRSKIASDAARASNQGFFPGFMNDVKEIYPELSKEDVSFASLKENHSNDGDLHTVSIPRHIVAPHKSHVCIAVDSCILPDVVKQLFDVLI